MRTWKYLIFAAVFILIGGTFSANAQDIITLKDGGTIEVKVLEISPTEIKYKRFSQLDGPTIVIPVANVQSIKYEDGTYEILNDDTVPQQKNTQGKNTAIDQGKFIFGINVNAGGAIGYILPNTIVGSGIGVNVELGKGNFNSEINLLFPTGGVGILFAFNYFKPGSVGGFYIGGGVGYLYRKDILVLLLDSGRYTEDSHINTLGLNLGYKFVLPSGLYFRTGAYVGAGIDWASYLAEPKHEYNISVVLKPDLAIGWTMR